MTEIERRIEKAILSDAEAWHYFRKRSRMVEQLTKELEKADAAYRAEKHYQLTRIDALEEELAAAREERDLSQSRLMNAEHRAEVAQAQVEALDGWLLVERYCESFKDDDFRLVFRRSEHVLEISVGKEAWESFSEQTKPAEPHDGDTARTEAHQRWEDDETWLDDAIPEQKKP